MFFERNRPHPAYCAKPGCRALRGLARRRRDGCGLCGRAHAGTTRGMGLVLVRVARLAFAGLAIAAIAAAIRVTGSLVDFFRYQDVR